MLSRALRMLSGALRGSPELLGCLVFGALGNLWKNPELFGASGTSNGVHSASLFALMPNEPDYDCASCRVN
eukprot:10851536-Alexandrium_andersonii.AAC.1